MTGLGQVGTGRVRLFLRDLGWEVDRHFRWRHHAWELWCDLRPAAGSTAEALPQNLRESWRLVTWNKFIHSARKDSRIFRNTPYDAACCKAAQRAAVGAHEVAVLTGAFVSPARFHVMTHGEASDLCFRGCGCVGHFMHVAWDCPLLSPLTVPTPRDDLQRYLGWPTFRRTLHA